MELLILQLALEGLKTFNLIYADLPVAGEARGLGALVRDVAACHGSH